MSCTEQATHLPHHVRKKTTRGSLAAGIGSTSYLSPLFQAVRPHAQSAILTASCTILVVHKFVILSIRGSDLGTIQLLVSADVLGVRVGVGLSPRKGHHQFLQLLASLPDVVLRAVIHHCLLTVEPRMFTCVIWDGEFIPPELFLGTDLLGSVQEFKVLDPFGRRILRGVLIPPLHPTPLLPSSQNSSWRRRGDYGGVVHYFLLGRRTYELIVS